LPGCTELALASPMWFYAFTTFFILATAALFIRKVPVLIMVHSLLIACILEGFTLFSFALSLCLPFVTIIPTLGE
jgi:hypothetical protein